MQNPTGNNVPYTNNELYQQQIKEVAPLILEAKDRFRNTFNQEDEIFISLANIWYWQKMKKIQLNRNVRARDMGQWARGTYTQDEAWRGEPATPTFERMEHVDPGSSLELTILAHQERLSQSSPAKSGREDTSIILCLWTHRHTSVQTYTLKCNTYTCRCVTNGILYVCTICTYTT